MLNIGHIFTESPRDRRSVRQNTERQQEAQCKYSKDQRNLHIPCNMAKLQQEVLDENLLQN